MALGGIIFVSIAVWLTMSFGVAAHASDNGKTRLWGLAVGVFLIVGLVIYAMTLDPDPE